MTAASRCLEIPVVPNALGRNFGAVYMHPYVLKHLPKAKRDGPYSEGMCLENQVLRQFKVLIFAGHLQH